MAKPAPGNPNEVVAFVRRDARRIQASVRDYERRYQNPAPPRGIPVAGAALRHAQTTTSVSARSGTTAGSGSAQLYHLENGVLTADSPAVTVPVKNVFGSAIASGKWVIIAPLDGVWSVIAADCP